MYYSGITLKKSLEILISYTWIIWKTKTHTIIVMSGDLAVAHSQAVWNFLLKAVKDAGIETEVFLGASARKSNEMAKIFPFLDAPSHLYKWVSPVLYYEVKWNRFCHISFSTHILPKTQSLARTANGNGLMVKHWRETTIAGNAFLFLIPTSRAGPVFWWFKIPRWAECLRNRCIEYWATRSSVRLVARSTLSFACSTLLPLLCPFVRSLTCSLSSL